ncbi:hypothetical protein [Anaplasma phagocytophilum]|uniref:hypothetical protein n=1 Tax=Anaplasma phagocytophilum TaxID=948 RepID=UPI00200FF483|nr:hypothetical protein [Anaplasma phagocytophilum]UQD54384.1 hypothetical protein ESP60_03300 [Anaplasma phagocytophilum]
MSITPVVMQVHYHSVVGVYLSRYVEMITLSVYRGGLVFLFVIVISARAGWAVYMLSADGRFVVA